MAFFKPGLYFFFFNRSILPFLTFTLNDALKVVFFHEMWVWNWGIWVGKMSEKAYGISSKSFGGTPADNLLTIKILQLYSYNSFSLFIAGMI